MNDILGIEIKPGDYVAYPYTSTRIIIAKVKHFTPAGYISVRYFDSRRNDFINTVIKFPEGCFIVNDIVPDKLKARFFDKEK